VLSDGTLMTHSSLKDVAARAGVSFQTASKVLNGQGGFAKSTRARILAASEALGYVPNALARSLAKRSTYTIGVIATDLSDTTLAQHIVGVEREARRRGLCVIIGSLDRSGSDAEEYLKVLLERRVDGIIIDAPVTESNVRVGEIVRGSVPAVSMHEIAGGGISVVSIDDRQSGLLPVRHLLSLGHKRIGMITGARRRRVTSERTAAYRQALEEFGIGFDPALVEEGRWEVEDGYRGAHRLLDRCRDITAIYAQNDMMAIGVLGAAHDRGLRVPDDCAVVGCDNLPMASRTIPPLTTVDVPFYATGEVAMQALIELMAARTAEPIRRVLPVHMIYRSSTMGEKVRVAGPPARQLQTRNAAARVVGPPRRRAARKP
jgi:LacI family transcriptional regulator, galactose operon repressor